MPKKRFVQIDYRLNNLIPTINTLPIIAGKIKLIIQMPAAAETIPIVFTLNNPNSCKLILPLKPSSASAIVGTIAITKKSTATIIAKSSIEAATPKTSSKTTYCTTNTK